MTDSTPTCNSMLLYLLHVNGRIEANWTSQRIPIDKANNIFIWTEGLPLPVIALLLAGVVRLSLTSAVR